MVKSVNIKRGDVFRKYKRTRPCVIVSPDELNGYLQIFISAPMTTGDHSYPFRIGCRFQRKNGYVVADQIRTIDRNRVVRTLGQLSAPTLASVLNVLQEMFAA
jgi:mRNA interferase MazF